VELSGYNKESMTIVGNVFGVQKRVDTLWLLQKTKFSFLFSSPYFSSGSQNLLQQSFTSNQCVFPEVNICFSFIFDFNKICINKSKNVCSFCDNLHICSHFYYLLLAIILTGCWITNEHDDTAQITDKNINI